MDKNRLRETHFKKKDQPSLTKKNNKKTNYKDVKTIQTPNTK